MPANSHFDSSPIDLPPIGATAEDQTPIGNHAATRHIGTALGQPNLPLGSLVNNRQSPFGATPRLMPDPSAYLQRLSAENATREVANGVSLSVLTYNVAQLNVRVGGMPVRVSPYRLERLPRLIAEVFALDADIVLLQELWTHDSLSAFVNAGRRCGYIASHSPRGGWPGALGFGDRGYTDGLLTLIKQHLVSDSRPPISRSLVYSEQVFKEYLFANIRRGAHSVTFGHRLLGDIQVTNTHAQAFPSAFAIRMRQMRELGIWSRAIAKPATIRIAGGDENAGPFYAHDELITPSGDPVGGWFDNSMSWAIGQVYFAGHDAVAMGRQPRDATDDIAATTDPDIAARTHTATDENPLYRMQYEGLELPARLDHIKISRSDRIRVIRSAVLANDLIKLASGATTTTSDHRPVMVWLDVSPLP